jgi:hypothetical protein
LTRSQDESRSEFSLNPLPATHDEWNSHCYLKAESQFDCRPRREVDQSASATTQILSYFLRNPSATDSLEGIARWRLLEEAIHRNVWETEKALQWLVREGYLVETVHPHSGRLFSLNAERQSEAKSLLDLQEQTGAGGKSLSERD